MNIRKAIQSDLPVVYELMKEIPHLTIPDYDVFLFDIARGHYPEILVAIENKNPVGMAIYNNAYYSDGACVTFLDCLAVKKECRGKGIGKAILSYLKKLVKAEYESVEISFCCHKTNNAYRFYKKMGAKPNRSDEFYQSGIAIN